MFNPPSPVGTPGMLWKKVTALSTKGSWTNSIPLSLNHASRSLAEMGMSPDPKSLYATRVSVSVPSMSMPLPRNSFWPVPDPTAR